MLYPTAKADVPEGGVPPRVTDIGAILVQVKNYNSDGNPLGKGKFEETVLSLFNSARELCGKTRPCLVIIIQVGRSGISGFSNSRRVASSQRIFKLQNVMFIVKPHLDKASYPFLTEEEIRLLNPMPNTNRSWEGIVESLRLMGLENTSRLTERSLLSLTPMDCSSTDVPLASGASPADVPSTSGASSADVPSTSSARINRVTGQSRTKRTRSKSK